MSQNKLWKEKKLILPWIKWIKKNRNIVTSIFLKLDYIYLIKLIKQIKYIIPLQKQIKLITKYFFFFFKYIYIIKEQLWHFCQSWKKNKQKNLLNTWLTCTHMHIT